MSAMFVYSFNLEYGIKVEVSSFKKKIRRRKK